MRTGETETCAALSSEHGHAWQSIDQCGKGGIIQRFRLTGRCLWGVFACGQERERARDIAAQCHQQAEWVVGRYTEREGNCGALSFFGKQAAKDRFAEGVIIFGFALRHRTRHCLSIGIGQPIWRIGEVHCSAPIDRKRPRDTLPPPHGKTV